MPLRILQYVCNLLAIIAESAAAASAFPVVADIPASVDHLYVMLLLLLLLLLIWLEFVTVDCFGLVRATVTTAVYTPAPAANNLAPVCLLQRWIVPLH